MPPKGGFFPTASGSKYIEKCHLFDGIFLLLANEIVRIRCKSLPAHGIFSAKPFNRFPCAWHFFADIRMPSFASRDPALITQSSLRSLRSLHYDCTYLSPLLRGSPLSANHCRPMQFEPANSHDRQIPPASLPSRKNAMRRGSEACDREKMPCAGEIPANFAFFQNQGRALTFACFWRKTPPIYILN